MLEALVYITLGLIALVAGGELLVRGASRLAGLAGVAPLVVGLTVVAFGTSAPELFVSVRATWSGQTDIAVGNVVGSNIFNVLFILGVSALIAPLIVSSQLIRIDVPLMIAASILTLLLGMDGNIGRLDGIGLFVGLICYVVWTVVKSRRENALVEREYEQELATQDKSTFHQVMLQGLLIVGGLVLLGFGANWTVSGASTIGRLAGMSELLIGLTIVAVGTSLPEVAASVVASIRGERDIAVGNVVGSNLFNITCVLGVSSAIAPNGVEVSDAALRLDIPVMIAVAVACLPIFFTGHLIARWEGGLFLAYYVAYVSYLVLASTSPDVSRQFGFVLLAFVLPLTAITLVIGVVRAVGKSTA